MGEPYVKTEKKEATEKDLFEKPIQILPTHTLFQDINLPKEIQNIE